LKVEVVVAVSRLFDVSMLFLDGKNRESLSNASILANSALPLFIVNETASLTFGQTCTDTSSEMTTLCSSMSSVIST
jgi:hypothetical protein